MLATTVHVGNDRLRKGKLLRRTLPNLWISSDELPKIRLQNFKCIFSASLYILKILFLKASIEFVLPIKYGPQISQLYSEIGNTIDENNFVSVFTGVFSIFEKLLNKP